MSTAAKNAAENPVLGVEYYSVIKRLNGCIGFVEPSPTPSDPSVYKGSHARDSLGSRAAVSETAAIYGLKTETAANSDAEPDYASFDVPGADPSDNVEPFVMVSTPEHIEAATAFFEVAKSKETAAQKTRARTQSQVFSVMQYLNNPATGEPMTSQEHIDAGLEALKDRIYRVAYIWHVFDRIVDVDEGTGEPFCSGLKGPHFHMVIWCHRGDGDAISRPTIRTVSDAFMVPSAKVVLPNEKAAQGGGYTHKGRNASEKAFFDLAEYLPHESRRSNTARGITQSERFYLVDKYQYGRGRVVANFDFSKELDAHMAGRASAADNGMGLKARKTKLRRAVMDGMTLAEAREKDRDAYADDLPRLRDLRSDYEQMQSASLTAGLGETWYKTPVLICGEKGVGKGVLVDQIVSKMQTMATLGDVELPFVEPPATNAQEAIGTAKLVHHDDARYDMLPSYNQGLNYLDNNRAIEVSKRHSRSKQVVGPRVILMSTTETPQSFGLSLKARRSSDVLAYNAKNNRLFPPSDIDEYLRRLYLAVEVSLPSNIVLTGDDLTDYPVIRREMLVTIQRVITPPNGERHVEPVVSRSGAYLGQITTTSSMERVAVIKGVEAAARYLAIVILLERNSDIAKHISPVEVQNYLAQKTAVEVVEHERIEREKTERREAEMQVAVERGYEIEHAALAAELKQVCAQVMHDLCTCASYPGAWDPHDDACPLVTDQERQSRDARWEKKAEHIRKNSLLLGPVPTPSNQRQPWD